MRVPVKSAKGRRDPVGVSNPTYEVDLTWEEMIEVRAALEYRVREAKCEQFRDSVSALAAVQWAQLGRK